LPTDYGGDRSPVKSKTDNHLQFYARFSLRQQNPRPNPAKLFNARCFSTWGCLKSGLPDLKFQIRTMPRIQLLDLLRCVV
jgi:hypothetical protein